jgi:hypothetical protein
LGTIRILHVVRIDLSPRHAERLLDPRRPYLSVLAVAAAGDGSSALEVAERALEIAKQHGGALGNALTDDILLAANESVRRELERQMHRQGFRSPFLRKLVGTEVTKAKREGRKEGAVKTLRAALYKVLHARTIALTDDLRRRIDSEGDMARLERWHDAAITASTAADVFMDA